MFVGHLAVAMASKRYQPSLSLGWYVAAAIFVDMLWPVFILLGIEQVTVTHGSTAFQLLTFDSYPWSHSLLMGIVWGVGLGGLARWRGASAQAAVLVGALVVSHWVLDFATHAPDLPLWPGASPKVGLGLWNSIPATYVVEGLLWIAGMVLYLRPRRAADWVGPVALWSLVVITTATWAAGPWGPPPPTAQALGWFGMFGWIMVPWAAWADRHYVLRAAHPPVM